MIKPEIFLKNSNTTTNHKNTLMKKYLITKILLLYWFCSSLGMSYAQTTDTENYVQSINYLDSTKVSDPSKKRSQTVQYFDGLGRLKQTVNVKASPLGRDLVTPFIYDNIGRQAREYFPVPQNSSTGGAIYQQASGAISYPVADPGNIYAGEKIFSEKQFENSPLDRIQQLTQPGTAWSTKPVQYAEGTNRQNDNVKKYETVTSWDATNKIYISSVSQSSFFTEGQLYKNTTTDEDGNKTIEFKNGRGQTILSRKVLSPSENADTYYVYNEYEQLAYIIPPAAAIATPDTTVLDNLCYQYRYDSRYRLAEKKLPGKGWDLMVYDKQDRLILTQDAVLRTTINSFGARGWLFTKYDQFDRVVYTGFFSNTATRIAMQTAVNNMAANAGNNETRTETSFMLNNLVIYYTKNAFPTGSMTILTVNYYDSYPTNIQVEIPTTILGQKVLTQPGQGKSKNTSGLPVASYLKNIEDGAWTMNFNWYDTKGRIIGTNSINHLAGFTNTKTEYDFAGMVKQRITNHKKSRTDGEEIQVKERFVYDDQNRILKHYHQVNNLQEELLADNTYNEIGQLTNKKTGNTSGTPLQSIDYAYNIRGWVTKVNNPANLGEKLFAYELKYENPADAAYAPAKYNGNISEFDWRTANGNFLRRYAYKYDALERLKDASYREPNATAPVNDGYTEKLTYDLNGNIQTLKRYQALANVPILIDDLKYQVYEGNRLKKVVDENTNPSGYPSGGNTIAYDGNGNMTDHLDKGITSILYNFLNLPKEVNFAQDNNKLQFLYRADGTKLKKTYTYFASRSGLTLTKNTEYLDGFQYEQAGGSISSLLQFFPTAEGYYDFQKKRYVYNYEDHLGNIRLSYYQSTSVDAVVIDKETNYYQLGMEYDGWNGTNSQLPSYTYGFQGQEKQTETGWSSFKWRNSIPELGRFFNVDPLSEKYAYQSHYNFSENRVVDNVELEGLEGEDFRFRMAMKQKGGVQARAEEASQAANSAAFMAVIKTVTPVEELYTLASGRDLDGNPASRKEAGTLLALNFVPEAKVEVKVASSVLKAEAKAEAKAAAKAEAKAAAKAEAKAISKDAVEKNGTLTKGPFAGEGHPAKNGKSRNFTAEERKVINEQGYTLGCHTCGQKNPGTKSGNWILDHQPANALVPAGWPQTFYPHCRFCSSSQGGIIGGMKKQGKLPKISN
jgi:RHS repeat-associated protein